MNNIFIWAAVGVAFVLAFLTGEQVGKSAGRQEAWREAYKTNPPNERMEHACLALWVGERAREQWRKDNAAQ